MNAKTVVWNMKPHKSFKITKKGSVLKATMETHKELKSV